MRNSVPEVRTARPAEAEVVASLVNTAYEVEGFFVEGDRTSGAEARALMARGGFIVSASEANEIVACIYVEVPGATASFGMLAVTPELRGRGVARRLIEAAEDHARRAGAMTMEIQVVNLRTELFPFYERLGYVRTGTAPYAHRPITRPCHFVVMAKKIGVRS